MSTKIYVSQIDTANSTGGQANVGALLVIGSSGPYWSNQSVAELANINLAEIVGYTGSVGYQGSLGTTGYFGSTGYTGSTGDDGVQGAVGYQGSIGSTGYLGSVGYTGSVGDVGYLGSAGYQGSLGGTGYTGSVGDQGSAGYQGSVGYQGSAGDPGNTTPFAFTTLTDVPSSYTSKANHFVRVNATANGLYFDSNSYVTNSFGTSVNFNGNTVISPSLKSYSEVINVKGDTGSEVTLEFADGNIHTLTLNAASVAIILSTAGLNAGKAYTFSLALTQDATGGRTVDWSNQTIVWPSGEGIYSPEGPTLTSNAYYTDFVSITTFNGGTSWYGVMSAKGFPPP